MSGKHIVEVDFGGDSVAKPREDQIARSGPRRIVKFMDIKGMGGFPVIWTSPYDLDDPDNKGRKSKICVILMATNPPETMRVTVDAEALEKMNDTVVEW